MIKAVAIVSGGMDSVTLAHYVKEKVDEVHGLGFNYGQRHKKELTFAEKLVKAGVLDSYQVVDLTNLKALLSKSVLTDHDRDVPDGHYAEETMKQTVVPNRNMIMLSIAAGFAVTIEATRGVWTGVHGGDHFIYPDCRPGFIDAANRTIKVANEGFLDFDTGAVNAPFLMGTKGDIVLIGTELGVDYAQTWSCYKGGRIHCGRCGTCVERKEAFGEHKIVDPTKYEDEDFEIKAYRG